LESYRLHPTTNYNNSLLSRAGTITTTTTTDATAATTSSTTTTRDTTAGEVSNKRKREEEEKKSSEEALREKKRLKAEKVAARKAKQTILNNKLKGNWKIRVTSPEEARGVQGDLKVQDISSFMGGGTIAVDFENMGPAYCFGKIYEFIEGTGITSEVMKFETRWKVLGKNWKGCLMVEMIPGDGDNAPVSLRGKFRHGVKDESTITSIDFESY